MALSVGFHLEMLEVTTARCSQLVGRIHHFLKKMFLIRNKNVINNYKREENITLIWDKFTLVFAAAGLKIIPRNN
jgi:hypothetical protein